MCEFVLCVCVISRGKILRVNRNKSVGTELVMGEKSIVKYLNIILADIIWIIDSLFFVFSSSR